jgi:hypothetical protein
MKNSASIRVAAAHLELSFEWLEFDGDDCFNDFHINVTKDSDTRRFDFGPCAINGLRKLAQFFRDETELTVGGGFQFPNIRYYEVDRLNDRYCLLIHSENELHERYQISTPSIQINDEFLRNY